MRTSAMQNLDTQEELGTLKYENCLIEVQTEELPPKTLLTLAEDFYGQIKDRLIKAELGFKDIVLYATPRRLAVLVEGLSAAQADQTIERRGPAKQAAFDASGNPTKACIGFAKSCGVTAADLIILSEGNNEWVGCQQHILGKPVAQVLPTLLEQALNGMYIAKRMRWGAGATQFVRPIHSIILLYGDKLIDAEIFGCRTNRMTRGHRFHAPAALIIANAESYSTLLEKEGFVIADYIKRRELIREEITTVTKKEIQPHYADAEVLISSEDFLNEVTGLVEWPVALVGTFDSKFLNLPQEALISSMQDHQRYFPVVDSNQNLLPYFVMVANIAAENPATIIHGNERVLRARLSDAAFFYEQDKLETLASRVERLNSIVNQAKLGSMYEKVKRLEALTGFIVEQLNGDVELAKRAGLLAKSDLTTLMVNEFPELQGVMGSYYALSDGEDQEVVLALKEYYWPRFGGDSLPQTILGQALAIADRMDACVGAFGIEQIPTGDRDPFGLRRASLGLLRILIENNIDLDLTTLLTFSVNSYGDKLSNSNAIPQILAFMNERMRNWYGENEIPADVFNAVAELKLTIPADIHARIHAVNQFKAQPEAASLVAANKRVGNILSKYTAEFAAKAINQDLFEQEEEKILSDIISKKEADIIKLTPEKKYGEILLLLAELKLPIDNFFDRVMVMSDNEAVKENRLLLLKKLRTLFLNVADIAHLNF